MPVVDTSSRRTLFVAAAAAVAVPIFAWAVRRHLLARSKKLRGRVRRLMSYPVKGLDFTSQALPSVTLQPGGTLPFDRQWALKKGKADPQYGEFDARNPQWVHKMRFAASCSEGVILGGLRAEWRDQDCALSIFAKNRRGPALLAPASLLGPDTLKKAEDFFRESLADPGLQIVTAAPERRAHQFANTKPLQGMEGLMTLHIVNLATVHDVSRASGIEVDWRRFRPNILLDSGEDLPAWGEFQWVGRLVRAGDAWLRVTKRTIRCDATKVNPDTAREDLDMPGLLQRHFPEHGPYLGVYAVVERGGEVKEGDLLEGPF
uniref:MOSC domain-containing protein n=1 Tax=Pyrodinium bahamense TaxID=73915 RepID=A0A7S0AGC1_9DINO